MTHLAVIGDCLLDEDWTGRARRLCPESAGPVLDVDCEVQRPGGAGYAAIEAARTGAEVTFFTALSADRAGHWLREELQSRGIDVVDLGLEGPTPEKIRIRTPDATLLRIDRGCSHRPASGDAGVEVLRARSFDAVLVSDYGRGITALPQMRAALSEVALDIAVVWDPHPAGSPPVPHTSLATPSTTDLPADIAGKLHAVATPQVLEQVAAAAAARWNCPIALTCGASGAVVFDGQAVFVPTAPVSGDTNGAGDVLAAVITQELATGASLINAVRKGVRAATLHVEGRVDDDLEAVRAARRSGRRVVATSGCFDILHAGHLAMLQYARSLGDVLCICLNSDVSVRALKGAKRPITPQSERTELLRALSCVDFVIPFDETTPCELLRLVRPELYVKGGDYEASSLVEQPVLAEWGGQVVIGPYVPDRSTSGLLDVARRLAV